MRHARPSLVIVMTAAALLAGCDLLNGIDPGSVSISERLDRFVNDLNSSDRTWIYLNFHPDETLSYNQVKDPDTWENSPLSSVNRPFSLRNTVQKSLVNGTVEVTGNLTQKNNPDTAYPISFVMAKYGEDWRIVRLTYTVVETDPYEIRTIRIGE
jgi:hypothetical protein